MKKIMFSACLLGIATRLFKANGIKVLADEDLKKILE